MNCSFIQLLEDRFKQQIYDAVSGAIEEDNTRYLPVKIRTINIKYINTSILLQCEDYAELPTFLNVETCCNEDGRAYRRAMDIACTISGTFSKNFDDFRIYGLRIMKNITKFKDDYYTNTLLPHLNTEQMEEQAMRLIKKGYGYSYDVNGTTKINPLVIAKALGIKVFFVRLSEDSTVRGVYVMKDADVLIYDDKTRSPKYVRIIGKTILVEKNICEQEEVVRFTIMHELVHAFVQRFAFYLMAMSRKAFFEFRCPVRINDDLQFMDAFLEKLERQADMIAAYTLMPQISFKRKVSEIQSDYGALRNSSCVKEMIDKTARHYGVSISAARRRMLELGFNEVQGVYNFIDGKYVPAFGFKNGSLKPNQTYCVSEAWAKQLLTTNKKLLKMVAKGVICFVETHFILNDPKYLTADKQLTVYGREHLHECSLKFDLCYLEKRYFPHKSDSNIAFRAVNSTLPMNMLYADDNADIEEKARLLCKRNTAILDLVKNMPDDFCESLVQVVNWTQRTKEQIAADSWISERTIYRLCSHQFDNPSVNLVIQLCIGMDLPFEVSIKLIERAGYKPRNTLRDMSLMQLLILSYKYSIEDCNRILRAQGLAPLVAKNPAA